VLHRQRFAVPEGYPLPAAYDVAVCARCGMIFADTPGTQADYDRFYTTWSIYQSPAMSPSAGTTPPFDLSRFEQASAAFAPAIGKEARILDVGCANGGMLEALGRRGFKRLAGVDPARACVEHVRGLGFDAWQGEITRLPAGIGPFDAVVLTAVLEHILDVKGAIESLSQVCAADGAIFLEVPDAMRYADYLNAPFQDFNTEHINHFSPAALRNLMGQFGFFSILEQSFIVKNPAGMEFAGFLGGYRRSGDRAAPALLEDTAFRGEMERYIDASGAMMARLDGQLREALARATEVIVWGTGQLAMKLLCDTFLGQMKVAVFVDGNPIQEGRTLCGARIVTPEKVESGSVPIVITTLLHTDGIRARIAELGLANPVITLTAR
jgi:2-polyprenyl-3-methyl-5-hydroxy-6-metoxy-1,4-benzoquinol methylase